MGNKSNTNLKEYQSFTDLKFSKNKVITWIDWHPTIKGTLAVSCGGSYSFDEQIDLSSHLLHTRSLILIWTSLTPYIHINGQIVLWDIESHQDCLQINKAPDPTDSGGTAANMAIFDTDPKLDHAPIVQYSMDVGHSMAVCNLHWIPSHIEVCTSTALKVASNGYIATVLAFFDRETKRLEFTAERTTLRANGKKAIDSAQIEREKEDNPPQDTQNWEEQAMKDYEEYLALEKALLIQLGLIESDTKEE